MNLVHVNYWVGKKLFAFFSKISWNGRERSRILHIRSIYRWYEYCLNDNKIIEMEVDLELEMKLSRRELRLLLLHEFRLGLEATSNIIIDAKVFGKMFDVFLT